MKCLSNLLKFRDTGEHTQAVVFLYQDTSDSTAYGKDSVCIDFILFSENLNLH